MERKTNTSLSNLATTSSLINLNWENPRHAFDAITAASQKFVRHPTMVRRRRNSPETASKNTRPTLIDPPITKEERAQGTTGVRTRRATAIEKKGKPRIYETPWANILKHHKAN